MSLDVFYSDTLGNYHQIDVIDAELVLERDFSKGESFEFSASPKIVIPRRAFIRVQESGHTLWRGAAMYATGELNGEPLDWTCWSIPQLAKTRMPFPMRYGAPVVEEDYSALTVGDIISSDPPSQAAGVAQYVPGLVWMLQSYLSVSPTSIDDDGVRFYDGWGTNSRAGTKAVYVGGHLCTEESLGDVASTDYSFHRNGGGLYARGVGVGDLGPFCIDGAFDYGLRIGEMDHSGDYHLAALDIGIGDNDTSENYWQIIEDYLFSLGIYLRLRHVGDLTYIDGSINPWARGAVDRGAFRLSSDDWISLEQRAPNDIAPSALIGAGAGAGITRVLYSQCDPTDRGAWIESLEEISEGLLSPMGFMDLKVDALWDELNSDEFFVMKTSLDYLKPGDWLDLQVSKSRVATVQVYEIKRGIGPIREVALGGRYAAPEWSFLEKQESLSIADHRAGQMVGSQEASDNIGPSDSLVIAWTPAASDDRDTERITLSLWATEPSDSTESARAVTFTVSITNTTYSGGQVIATIRNAPWGSDPIFEDLDITEWCALDGSEETITISASDPWGELSEVLGYTARVSGIGRYGQTPKVIMDHGAVISSSLSGNIYIGHLTTIGGTSSGEAWYALENKAKPDYAVKVVAVHSAYLDTPVPATGTTRVFIITNSKRFYGATKSLAYGWLTFEDEWKTNPDTRAPWTQSDLNDLQIGIQMSVTSGTGYGVPYQHTVVMNRCGWLRVELR